MTPEEVAWLDDLAARRFARYDLGYTGDDRPDRFLDFDRLIATVRALIAELDEARRQRDALKGHTCPPSVYRDSLDFLEARLNEARALIEKLHAESEPETHKRAPGDVPPGWCPWCDASRFLASISDTEGASE